MTAEVLRVQAQENTQGPQGYNQQSPTVITETQLGKAVLGVTKGAKT